VEESLAVGDLFRVFRPKLVLGRVLVASRRARKPALRQSGVEAHGKVLDLACDVTVPGSRRGKSRNNSPLVGWAGGIRVLGRYISVYLVNTFGGLERALLCYTKYEEILN
jgi:hypothetical protein